MGPATVSKVICWYIYDKILPLAPSDIYVFPTQERDLPLLRYHLSPLWVLLIIKRSVKEHKMTRSNGVSAMQHRVLWNIMASLILIRNIKKQRPSRTFSVVGCIKVSRMDQERND